MFSVCRYVFEFDIWANAFLVSGKSEVEDISSEQNNEFGMKRVYAVPTKWPFGIDFWNW